MGYHREQVSTLLDRGHIAPSPRFCGSLTILQERDKRGPTCYGVDMKTVYIETSILSYLTARPSRDLLAAAHQQVTRRWWDVHQARFVELPPY